MQPDELSFPTPKLANDFSFATKIGNEDSTNTAYLHNTSSTNQDMTMMNKLAAILFLLAGKSNANNDECTSAMRLYENEPVAGTNSFAVSDFSDRNACGPNSHLEGVWYEIIGTGEEITLKVCTENERMLSVGVFSACNSESCVGFPASQSSAASCERNEYLSYQFFAARNRSYRVHIRANVLEFANTVLGAEFKVFYRPTGSPTPAPTTTPLTSPGTPPPTKAPPPMLPVTGTPYQTSDFGKVSTCRIAPPTGYRIEGSEVWYEYTLPKNSLDAAALAVEIEEELQQAVSQKFLTCTYDELWKAYSVVQIAVGIRDRVIAKECTATSDGTPCSIVRGSMDMELAFRNDDGRRLNDALNIDLLPIFRDTLQSLGAEFDGFVDPNAPTSNDKVPESEDDNTDAIIVEKESGDNKSALLLGLGIAIGVIALFMVLLCVRRVMRRESKGKFSEGVHEPEHDEERTMPNLDSPAHEVDYGDFNDNRVGLFENVELEGSDHDFRSCGNPECKHCKPESRPIFVSTRESDEPIGDKRSGATDKTLAYNDGWAVFDSRGWW